ncbi:hypothetical protein [Halapricum sp. CBA1109]|uniref:hypothetical protein n=1 Tax=Halapricum sp. CBA1109 TaxID=2668068 RepID=UPI0018D22E2E|nr:hypothetical protein [Halapricum sp. CBA1109]
MSDGDNPAVSDHLRPTDADVPDGVYRVVGTTDGVTLLRVGDADGRRVVTGEVRTVPDATGFEAAENPAGNRSLGRTVAGVPQTLYWQLRASRPRWQRTRSRRRSVAVSSSSASSANRSSGYPATLGAY